MLSMAGEVADGIQGHPLNTPIYLRDTVAPNLEAGASTAGRSPADLEVIVPTFAAPGSTSDEVQEWRELARMQVAFYGSTPNYRSEERRVGEVWASTGGSRGSP